MPVPSACSMMTTTGGVCSICQAVVSSETDKSNPESQGWISTTAQTFDVFRDAATQHCAICSTLWNLTEKHRDSWLNAPEAWEPLRYKPEGPREGENLVRLNVLYQDPLKGSTADLRFRLVAIDNDDYRSCFGAHDVNLSTSSETTLDTAYEWFQSCCVTHSSCGQLASSFPNKLPTRLIDIGKNGSTSWILRNLSEDHISPISSYVTLSYRWGTKPRLRLLSSNLAQLRRGSQIDDLPQTFKDAITVARHFQIQYIWIDALCIIQDSIEDWEAEAPTMRYIYANSACNIAASASSDPEDGMFRLRDPECIRPRTITSSLFAETPRPHYIFEKGYWNREIFDGPLHNRGWVFQERFLASRVLYFGKRQVLWECFSEHKCEGFPQGIPAHWSDKSVEPLLNTLSETEPNKTKNTSIFVFNLWNDLIKQFSQCELTNPSDKMFAMAGLAKLFQDVTGDEYVAGWWKSHLLESLDWRVFEPRPLQGSGYRAPSWSWASVDSPVRPQGMSPGMEILITLVDIQVITRGSDGMVNILGATLTLRGAGFTAVCHYLDNGRRVLQTDRGSLSTWFYPDSLDTALSEGKRIYCILYKRFFSYDIHRKACPRVTCFITEDAGVHADTIRYRRLGHIVLDEDQFEKFGTEHEHSLIVLI